MDVGPMVMTCKSWLEYYHTTDKINVLKDTIGLPSIARQRMYQPASKYPGFMGFSITEDSHQNLENLIVDNMVGGPSIIFTRYHEAGKTKLRDMPELVPQHSLDGTDDVASKNFSQLQMNYCIKQEGMKHRWNRGSELKIGPFFMDGAWPEENKITEVNGCHWHGCHRCQKYRSAE